MDSVFIRSNLKINNDGGAGCVEYVTLPSM